MEYGDALTPGSITLRLGIVFLLVLANGFFVAAEFALVGARRSKIDHLAASGDSLARTVQHALTHLDRYISGTQLGITLASLALGWLGEPALAAMIDRLFAAAGMEIPRGAARRARRCIPSRDGDGCDDSGRGNLARAATLHDCPRVSNARDAERREERKEGHERAPRRRMDHT